MTQSLVELPINYFGNPDASRSLSNAQIYVGIPGEDPEVLTNRYTIYLQNEDGTQTPITPAEQPVLTNAGGWAQYNGSVAQILVGNENDSSITDYSIKVLNNFGGQEYYFSSVLAGQSGTGVSESVLKFDTLSDAAASDSIASGDALYIKGRISGNVGGAFWDVVDTSTVTPNGYNIFQCTNLTDLSLVLRNDTYSKASQYGLINGNVNQGSVLELFFEYCSNNNLDAVIDIEIDSSDQDVSVPELLTINGADGGKLINTTLFTEGSLGTAVGLDADAEAFQPVIEIDPSSFSEGDDIFIYSCINCLSSDAGAKQLGSIAGNYSYFSEFRTVYQTGSDNITVDGGLVFDYSTTPGPHSFGRTNSTIQVVNFHKGYTLNNLKFEESRSFQYSLRARLTKNINQNNVTYNCTNIQSIPMRFEKSIDCTATDIKSNRPIWQDGDSTVSYLAFHYGCQNCHLKTVNNIGGRGVADFTFLVSDPNPSNNCTISDLTSTGTGFGISIHPGVYNCGAENITINAVKVTGMKIRSPHSTLRNAKFYAAEGASGNGLSLEDGYLIGSVIENVRSTGFLYGIEASFDDSGSATEPSIVRGHCRVTNFTGMDNSIDLYVVNQSANSELCNVVFENITGINARTSTVLVGNYCNGITIKGVNSIDPVQTGRAVVEYRLNLTNLNVDNVSCANAGDVYGLRGPSNSSFITDTTTFPLGNEEAQLNFGTFRFTGDLTTGREYVSILRDLVIFRSKMQEYGIKLNLGQYQFQALPQVEGDILVNNDSSGSNVFSIDQTGKFDGSNSNTVRDAISSANDINDLKTALNLFFVQ